MKILFVAAEMAPLAKVGGLADVVGSLPKALQKLGHEVLIVLPGYKMIEDDPRWKLEPKIETMAVKMNDHWYKNAHYSEIEVDGLRVGLVGTDEWFLNSVDSQSLYQPGGMMHLFFSKAVLRAMERLAWIPDVVHAHDWHMGFLPVLLREQFPNWNAVASVFTIHNQAYQGEFDVDILEAVGLPDSLFTYDKLETWGRVNFLKAGSVYSDHVNTVSQTYAKEIQTPEFGCMLEGLMSFLHNEGRLSGIVNGIDLDAWNPATDPAIAAHYDSFDTKGKKKCKTALLKELGMPAMKGAPLLGVVSRLSSQKGLDLILQSIEQMMAMPCQLIVQGLGDPAIADALVALEKKYPKQIRFAHRFDADLAQRVYAGCDGFLMPSAFEPCGLGQLIAMRYGTVPLVRATGGLADTVQEGHNGFVFTNRDLGEFVDALKRLCTTYANPEEWSKLMAHGMTGDYSWDQSAEQYVKIYEQAIAARCNTEEIQESA